MSISLIIKSGENNAELLIKPKITIGRSKSLVDISIDDAKISSQHLEITYENYKIMIRDLGSTNGTYVNNKKIKEHRLYIYETIKIGGCLITICLDKLTEIEQKSLTRPIDPYEDVEDITATSTVLSNETEFLALNKLSLEDQKVKLNNKIKARAKILPKKITKKEVNQEKTVMNKLFSILKK